MLWCEAHRSLQAGCWPMGAVSCPSHHSCRDMGADSARHIRVASDLPHSPFNTLGPPDSSSAVQLCTTMAGFVVLEIKPSPLCKLGKYSATELHSSAKSGYFF